MPIHPSVSAKETKLSKPIKRKKKEKEEETKTMLACNKK
jgi:hypothetical protein